MNPLALGIYACISVQQEPTHFHFSNKTGDINQGKYTIKFLLSTTLVLNVA